MVELRKRKEKEPQTPKEKEEPQKEIQQPEKTRQIAGIQVAGYR
jgi:hypothetical protein